MTLATSCILLFASPVLMTICFLGEVLAMFNNYPTQDHNPKHCARLKNTITYQKPLCVPNCEGGFTSDSEANCKGEFKTKCPEYNEGRCEWYDLTLDGSTRPVPTCRLCYYAKSETWMEVFFTHQYGDWMTNKNWNKNAKACANLSTMDIVEVHRNVKKTDAFGDRNQPDWPNNVVESTAQRGLHWFPVTSPQGLPTSILNSRNGMCSESGGNQTESAENRKLCEVDFVDYLKRVYPTGFFEEEIPKPSDDEKTVNCTVSYNLAGTCIDVVTREGIVTRGCQVLYTRSTVYNPDIGDKWKCEFVFLEFNGFKMPGNAGANNSVQMKLSYWSEEDKNARNKIFCNSRV